jgi:hypothetical protein
MIDLKNIIYAQTNTWPAYDEIEIEPNVFLADFISIIYRDGVFKEIGRLLESKEYPRCGGIGHIVLMSICSAIDSLSAYAYGGGRVGTRFTGFLSKYFPSRYSGSEQAIYDAFRCDSVHGWNLHKSAISPMPCDPNHLNSMNNIIRLSLYDFFNDLNKAFDDYTGQLRSDDNLRRNFLKRYKEIKR